MTIGQPSPMPIATAGAVMVGADAVQSAVRRAAQMIPPLWPLEGTVAVNPFLGMSGEPLAIAAARLRRTAGICVTLPRHVYRERIRSGEITDVDLAAATTVAPTWAAPVRVAELKAAAETDRGLPVPLATVADLAAQACGIDWPALVTDRISHWAAGYFDRGQALWAAPRGRHAYESWRAAAEHDLTPEIAGLDGFCTFAARLPESADAAIANAVVRLGLRATALEVYFHRLLTTLGGWAQFARYLSWQAELNGAVDGTLRDLLAIRLTWEVALLCQYGNAIGDGWRTAATAYAEPIAPTRDDVLDALLQEAAERAAQRQLLAALRTPTPAPPPVRPAVQMVFCIDVRSEVFRRALESLDPAIETLGFAGFFGLGVVHRRFASDVDELRLPALLSPSLRSCAGAGNDAERSDTAARIAARAHRAWGRFKLAAVSSFAFVEAMGPTYIGKLLRDAMGWSGTAPQRDPPPRFVPALDVSAGTALALQVLRAMSLTERFARLVVFTGHGANVVNNPHASALHCGACGGYSGEVNARLLASLLNDGAVRAALAQRGVEIPDDTLFLAALHDTTTDEVTLYDADTPISEHAADIARLRCWLQQAALLARGERALRMPRAACDADVLRRARDWAEVRPEWGLAGCQAFIAAPRARTAGLNLAGRAFLHDYDWRADAGFDVLRLILTAPVVVASWISLQYYGSTVAPNLFGAGNKLLHNVTGGLGVVEGSGGPLRAGLPWQSVHDGERLVHEPLRLAVLIEAPREAIAGVLARYPEVRALFDNRWLHLFALDGTGRPVWRYAGALEWSSWDTELHDVLPQHEPVW